jgi:hypothetical protein
MHTSRIQWLSGLRDSRYSSSGRAWLRVSAAAAVLLGAGPSLGQLVMRGEVNQTVFAGAFFDPKASPSSHLIEYLVAPNAKPTGRPWHGNELTPLVAEVLHQSSPFVNAAHLDFSNAARANPVALYVSRAQHETVTMRFPDHTAYNTVVSVAVALDIFTDRAASRGTRRFESLYSRLQIVEQPLLTDAPLRDPELKELYRRTLRDAVDEVAARAAEDLTSARVRAKAVFQIDRFTLPRELPRELDQLVEAALNADGRPNDAQEQQRELQRLSAEFQHTVHQFVVSEMRRRGLSDIAVLPPPSPWVDAYVLSPLRGQPSPFDGSEILSRINVTEMNGYTVTTGIVQASTVTTEERRGMASRVFAAKMAARIFRPRANGRESDIMPASLADLTAKTALGSGGEGYLDIVEFQRPTTREIALTAIRRASQDLAPRLVDLMVRTAQEVNR